MQENLAMSFTPIEAAGLSPMSSILRNLKCLQNSLVRASQTLWTVKFPGESLPKLWTGLAYEKVRHGSWFVRANEPWTHHKLPLSWFVPFPSQNPFYLVFAAGKLVTCRYEIYFVTILGSLCEICKGALGKIFLAFSFLFVTTNFQNSIAEVNSWWRFGQMGYATPLSNVTLSCSFTLWFLIASRSLWDETTKRRVKLQVSWNYYLASSIKYKNELLEPSSVSILTCSF